MATNDDDDDGGDGDGDDDLLYLVGVFTVLSLFCLVSMT